MITCADVTSSRCLFRDPSSRFRKVSTHMHGGVAEARWRPHVTTLDVHFEGGGEEGGGRGRARSARSHVGAPSHFDAVYFLSSPAAEASLKPRKTRPTRSGGAAGLQFPSAQTRRSGAAGRQVPHSPHSPQLLCKLQRNGAGSSRRYHPALPSAHSFWAF